MDFCDVPIVNHGENCLDFMTCILFTYLPICLCRYARQVAEFFEFVKKKKEVPSLKASEEAAAKSGQAHVLLPHKGGLWVPDGKHFPESALKSLDFRRAMSFLSG